MRILFLRSFSSLELRTLLCCVPYFGVFFGHLELKPLLYSGYRPARLARTAKDGRRTAFRRARPTGGVGGRGLPGRFLYFFRPSPRRSPPASATPD